MRADLGLHRSWAQVAFLASAGAGAVHLAAARPHLEEWAPAGAFMLACGVAQIAWAMWIVRSPSFRAVASGVVLNAGIVAVWLISRTTGMPIGPEAGVAEHVHTADALATGLEVAAVAAATAIGGRVAPHRVVVAGAAVAAGLAVLVTSHEPARERLTALASLLLVVAARAVVASIPRPLVHGRKDVTQAIVRSRPGPRRNGVRPGLGHGRPGTRPA